MSDLLSQNFLLAVVHALRSACKKSIKCDNFTLLSGFLSCDIDGKVQHRFVINELINSDNGGEGNSTFLKIIDWNFLGKKLSSLKNEGNYKQCSLNQSPLSHNLRGRSIRGNQIKGRCSQATSKTKQDAMQKCLSGPINQCHFTESRNKKTNQTFTLKDFQLHPVNQEPDCNVTHNFSNDTINILNKETSPEFQIGPDLQIPPDHQISPDSNIERKCTKRVCSYKVCRSISPALRSLCSGFECKLFRKESPIACVNDHLTDHLHTKNNCSEGSISSNFIAAEMNKLSCKNLPYNNGQISKSESENLNVQNAPHNSKKNIRPVSKESHTSLSGESDISIDSIRPRYLVKHNDELLLPCPNLSSKYNKHLSASKNNNRKQILSHQNCGETAANASHISNLLSTIIGAMSYSSTVNMQDASNNKCSLTLGLTLGTLKGSDKKDESCTDYLTGMNKSETKAGRSCTKNVAETPRFKIRPKKMSYRRRNTYSKEIGEPSLVAKREEEINKF